MLELGNMEQAPAVERQPIEGGCGQASTSENIIGEAPRSIALQPVAKGNAEISILRHGIFKNPRKDSDVIDTGVEIEIKNISDLEIDTSIFEAKFYDKDGNTLDTVIHKTFGLRPGRSRVIRIALPGTSPGKIETYNIGVLETRSCPKPQVIGNDKIEIFKHCITGPEKLDVRDFPNGVEFSIRNISGETIATAVFEITFCDIDGKPLEKTEKRITELRAGVSRAIHADCHLMEYKAVKTYNIKITRTLTADVEKIQLRRQERRTTATGEEEIYGTVKNISQMKTDIALVARYYFSSGEEAAAKVMLLHGIEPEETRQFLFKYKLPEGDKITKYDLTLAEIVDYC